MASLIPDTNYSPNTTAASNAYVAAQNRFSESLMDPINFLAKMNSDALAQKKYEEEKAIRAEDRAWKLEDRDRVAKERQAADAYYGELAKGVQTKGGIYGDALATEANKYALTPDEMLKATLYKNDANAVRAAGDSTLADKLAWQSKVSEGVSPFMQSGVGEESRVEMYDRINSMVGGQGLPIPKEAILSADQARLAEKTAEEIEAKRLKEAKADILKNDQANAWRLVNALGDTSTVLDAEGNEVQVNNNSRNSTRSGSKDLKDLSAGVSRISDAIKKANIDDKYIGTATDDALKARETLIARKNMTPDEASKLVADAIGSKDVGLIFTDNVPKFSEENLLKYADSQTRINNRAGITADNTASNINSKATQAANLSELLSAQNKTQLGSILDEQAKLAKGEEGRRADRVNAWLQDSGLLDVPKTAATAVDTSVGATGKPLEARINKSIKSIDGIPDSMVASEGVTNTAYKDGKGYSIAMGYNLAANKDSVDKDFKDANISPDKAFIAKTRPQDLVLADDEAQRLSQVAYYKYADNLDKKLGGTLDKLSPQMQATALQMHYRGDLYNDADYSKELRKYVAKDDFNGLVNYVSNNADKLPAPVVRRLENDLGAPVTSNLRGNMSDEGKADYLTKALNKGVESTSPTVTVSQKGLSISDTVKASELKPSADIKKDIDMLNSSLQKYKSIDEVPSTELDALKVLSDNYSLALKKEKLNKSSKDPFYKNFNWGRNTIGYGETKYNVSDEEKKLRSSKENPNASVEEAGLEDVSLDLVGGKIVTKAVPKIKKFANRNTIDEYLDVDQSTLQSIFGKYSPNVQGINRSAGITRDEIIAEMVKLRELKNPSKYDLQELQRLNALLGRFTKNTSPLKPEL